MLHFQFSPQAPKYLGSPLFPSHPISTSTHVTPCFMADHQALLLNLHGQSSSSSSPPTTHHCRNPAKIKSRPPPRPKPKSQQKPRNPPNHKSNHTHRNQSTKPTKQPKSQNENTESELTVKKTYIGFVIIFQKKNHLVELILDLN